jgi:hypothetical protein
MFVETKREGEIALDVKNILIEARNLIAVQERWCQHAQGLARDGRYVHPYDAAAVQNCALGALSRVLGYYVHDDHPARRALAAQVPDGRIGPWNNSHTHAEVLGIFDRAIASQ